MAKKNLIWRIVGSKRERNWSKKSRCSSREASEDGYLRTRVTLQRSIQLVFVCTVAVGHPKMKVRTIRCQWIPHRCFCGSPWEVDLIWGTLKVIGVFREYRGYDHLE